jgi:hypothetical protein
MPGSSGGIWLVWQVCQRLVGLLTPGPSGHAWLIWMDLAGLAGLPASGGPAYAWPTWPCLAYLATGCLVVRPSGGLSSFSIGIM